MATLFDGLFASCNLFHAIESASRFEPSNLLIVECVIKFNFINFAIGMFDFTINLCSWCQLSQTNKGNFVGWLNLQMKNAKELKHYRIGRIIRFRFHLIVIRWIGKCEWQKTLFFQVSFMDTGK